MLRISRVSPAFRCLLVAVVWLAGSAGWSSVAPASATSVAPAGDDQITAPSAAEQSVAVEPLETDLATALDDDSPAWSLRPRPLGPLRIAPPRPRTTTAPDRATRSWRLAVAPKTSPPGAS